MNTQEAEPRVWKPAGEPVGSVVGGGQVGGLPAAPATEVASGAAVSAAARAASAAFVLSVLGVHEVSSPCMCYMITPLQLTDPVIHSRGA